MNNTTNSLVTIDKLIICLKLNKQKDLIDFLTLYKEDKSGSIKLNNRDSLRKNYSQNEKDILCKLKYDLFLSNDKVGIFFFGTKNNEDFYFKIFNKVFYQSDYSIGYIISRVLNIFPFKYSINNISKLDLACDTVDSFVKNNAILVEDQCLNNNYFSNLKRRKNKINYDNKEIIGRTLNEAIYELRVPKLTTSQVNGIVHIGKFKNNKSVTIYLKNEFQQDYQESYFNTHFALGHDSITRVEIRLKSSFFIKNDFDLNRIDDKSYITDFFKSVSANYLTFNIINDKIGYDENNNVLHRKLNFLDNFSFKILPNSKTESYIIDIKQAINADSVVRQNKARLTLLMKSFAIDRSHIILDEIIDFIQKNRLLYYADHILQIQNKQYFFDYALDRFKKVVKIYDYDQNIVGQFEEGLKLRILPRFDKKGNKMKISLTLVLVNEQNNEKFGIKMTKKNKLV